MAQASKLQIIARNIASHHKDNPYMGSPLGYELGSHVSRGGAIVRAQALTIGQLQDDVILLQLPESLSVLFSCTN